MTISAPSAGPERRRARPSALWIALAGAGVAAIAYATLCPIGMRPHLASANVERFGAYFVLGGLIIMAAGRRVLAATALVVGLAVVLEAAQHLIPHRDPAVADALIKALGGVTGSALAALSYALRRRLARGWRAPLAA